MTKRRLPTLEEEFENLVDELPPMDHDEPKEPTAEELAREFSSAIEIDDEGDFHVGSSADVEETPNEAEFYDCDELIDGSEASWIEDPADDRALEVDMGAEIDEHSWVENEGENGDTDREIDLEDDWFCGEDEQGSISSDDGAEGPISSDPVQLEDERKFWDELSDEEADGLDEELESFETFGVDFSEGEVDLGVRYSAGFVLDKQFLGPEDGGVTDVCFSAAAPIAVGEGLFVIGADGLFHGIRGSHWLEKVLATSVCAFDNKIFLGTKTEGAFITEDQGRTLTQINSWYTSGLATTTQAALERFSTAFYLTGQVIKEGYRLYGRAGAGQLFASDDFGETWRGPLIPGRCRAMECVSGTQDLVAVLESPEASASIMRYDGVRNWEKLNIPEVLQQSLIGGQISLAAHSSAVLVAVDDLSCPLFETRDLGKTWNSIASLKGVTSLAMDPDEPSWVVAATEDPADGRSTIHFSEDGGNTWQAVVVLNDETQFSQGEAQTKKSVPVRAMSVDVGKERKVMVVKGDRVFLITLARPGVAH